MTTLDFMVDLVRDQFFAVDLDGRVWRQKIRTRWGDRCVKARRVDFVNKTLGYRYVKVTVARKQLAVPAHRLVWRVLRGPIPEGMEVNHRNGDRADNRPANLEVVTSSQNKRHSYRVLGHPRNDWVKWGLETQRAVLELRGEGLSYREIAGQLGVSASATGVICRKGLLDE